MTVAASSVQVVATYFAYAVGGVAGVVGVVLEVRNEYRLWRRRRDATRRAQARRERIAVDHAITRKGFNDPKGGVLR